MFAVDYLLNINTLVVFSSIAVLLCVLLGYFCPRLKLWKNLDLYYYTLAGIGAISLFGSQLSVIYPKLLLDEYNFQLEFWERYTPVDPRSLTNFHDEMLSMSNRIQEIESLIDEGCRTSLSDDFCSIRQTATNRGFPFGAFISSVSNQAGNFDNLCGIYRDYTSFYGSAALDLNDCWMYYSGEYYDSQYLTERFREKCDTPAERQSLKPFYTEPLIQSLNRGADTGICRQIDIYRAELSFFDQKKAEVDSRFRHRGIEGRTTQFLESVVSSSWFFAIWPYVLLVAISLKVGRAIAQKRQ